MPARGPTAAASILGNYSFSNGTTGATTDIAQFTGGPTAFNGAVTLGIACTVIAANDVLQNGLLIEAI